MKLQRIYDFSRIYYHISTKYIIDYDDLLLNCLFDYINGNNKRPYSYGDARTTITYSASRDELILVNTITTRVYNLSARKVCLFNTDNNTLVFESYFKDIPISERFINLFYEAAGINIKM